MLGTMLSSRAKSVSKVDKELIRGITVLVEFSSSLCNWTALYVERQQSETLTSSPWLALRYNFVHLDICSLTSKSYKEE